MPKFTFEQYRTIFEEAIKKYEGDEFFASLITSRGRPVFPALARNCAVIGMRHEGKETKFRENTADDTIALVRIDSDGNTEVWEYIGTTESGLFDKVYNAEGDFKMSPGFSYFKLGLHKGKYPCLVQACDVIGERAKKGQAFNETDDKRWQVKESIHIHAGIKNINNVGEWSAGCTVIAGGWDGNAWKQFYKYIKIATNMPIPYVLVNDADIPEFLNASQSSGANGSNGAHAVAVESVAAVAAVAVAPAAVALEAPTQPTTFDLTPVVDSAPSAASTPATRFDRDTFWSRYRDGLRGFGERVQPDEVTHVNNILDRASVDSRIQNLSQLAYMMTTARWETDRFRALYERGGDSYLMQYQGKGGNTRPGDYKRYRGTGYVHLTFRDNFRRAGQKLGAPLEDNPALAADPHWAYEIMVRGHLEGWFTKWKLGDFVNDSRRDFRGARRVINPGELNIADKALTLPAASRTKRQKQCVEALDAQIKWAGMIEACLRAAEVEELSAIAAAPQDVDEDETDAGPVLKPEPEADVVSAADFGDGPSPDETPEVTSSDVQVAVPSVAAAAAATTVAAAAAPVVVAAPAQAQTGQGGIVQASIGSIKRLNAMLAGGAMAVVAAIKGFMENKDPWVSAVIILVALVAVVWLVSWYIHVQRDLDKKRMELAADRDKNLVR